MNEDRNFHERGNGSRGNSLDLRRLGTVIGGSVLAVYGLSRRSRLGLALAAGGGALIVTGARANGHSTQQPARSTVLLNCTPEEAYRFWRNYENLPRFMRHLESVQETGDGKSRWIAIGPLGKKVSWDAEITEERPNELISWRSLPGSDVEVNGRVEFTKAPADRGTILRAEIEYLPPAGALGHSVAKLMGKDPKFLMTQDLRRLKALIEAGEIPTTEGQTHGPRSLLTGAARILDPDQPLRREARIGEVLSGARRVS